MLRGRARSGCSARARSCRMWWSCGHPPRREHTARIEALLERPRDAERNARRTPRAARVAFVLGTRALQYGDAPRRLERGPDCAECRAIDGAQEIGGGARRVGHRAVSPELDLRPRGRRPRQTSRPLRLKRKSCDPVPHIIPDVAAQSALAPLKADP